MAFARALTILFWLQALLLLLGLARRARLWNAGRAAEVDWTGLAAIPKRYLVDLHRVVARERYIANAHVATAGGAVLIVLLIALNYGLALYRAKLDSAIAAAAVLMLIGAAFMALRRRHPPARLSRGAWMRLPYTLGALSTGLLLLALPAALSGSALALLALLLVLIGSLELSLGIGSGGPMKHALAGLLHLGLHPRPERFRGGDSAALRPMALDSMPLGVERPADFRWNQLLGFDACVQCGKCEAACPAFAAGQPLNPKKLIQDLVLGMQGGSDTAYAGSPTPGLAPGRHAGSRLRPIVPALIEAQTLWSCTTCRACVQECPMLIEHVDAIIDLRRFQTLALGELPDQAAAALENLRGTATLGGYAAQDRYAWATDLDLPQLTLPQARPVDYLLIAGEGGFDPRYQRTLRALVQLLKLAAVDFAVLGALERDCGDTARRLGDEATFRDLAEHNIATLARFRFRHLLTADPHVLHCLRREYPALGGHYEVVHHTALLDALLRAGRLQPRRGAPAGRVTYHDPCYLARYNGETQAARSLLRQLGITVQEMQRAGLSARCCGGGGGAPLSDIPGKRRIPDIRMDDARSVAADVMAVACPGCTAMLEGVVAPRPQILDVAELLCSAVGA
jgi:Fe-S oxidoreductase